MAHQSKGNTASVTSFSPQPEIVDTTPSDVQPPGVDEEWEPQSLEEALLGEPVSDPPENPRRRVRYSG